MTELHPLTEKLMEVAVEKMWHYKDPAKILDKVVRKYLSKSPAEPAQEQGEDEPNLMLILVEFEKNLIIADKKQKESGVYADFKASDAYNKAIEDIKGFTRRGRPRPVNTKTKVRKT